MSEPVRWPDGVSARLVSVERVPSSWGVDVPKSRVIVRVTLEVANGGTEPLPIVPMSRETTLMYGANRTEGESVTGFSYDDPDDRRHLSTDGVTRIAAGGKATFVESSLVPADQLGELAVQVDVPAGEGFREPYTFTGAQALLKMVK